MVGNPLSPEQIAALLKPKASAKSEPISREGMTYCNFCKGWYNEYHYGDIDEEGGES